MKSLADRRRASMMIGARYYTLARHRDTLLKAAIADNLPREGRFLDAGCGKKLMLAQIFRDRCRLAVGVDLEAMAESGPGARGVVSDIGALPLAADAFDVIAMRSVSEHLADPVAAFLEIARVLRPGGAAIVLCPNKWYYSSILGRLVPERIAPWALRTIFGKNVYDNFPTYYRANTRRALRALASSAGLALERATPCEHPPDYLKLSPFLYRLGVTWDRVTSRWPPLHGLAVSYLFVMRKPVRP
ncbi:MAG: class I SAM-dependent methyltransferase [Acidobacteria bacterium]|nr:class I SAM-dependent methyltransferase [Acidobacteriota bacterium]